MRSRSHIKVKVKYLHLFKFYVARTLCKRVVCIRLKCYLFEIEVKIGKMQNVTLIYFEIVQYYNSKKNPTFSTDVTF